MKPSSFSPLRFAYSRAEPLLPLPRLVARRRHGRRAQLAADLRLRPISSKSARPASFSTFHRCFPTHPSPPPRAGTPPSVSRAAAAHRPPSSSHLRFPLAPTDRGNGFTSPPTKLPGPLASVQAYRSAAAAVQTRRRLCSSTGTPTQAAPTPIPGTPRCGSVPSPFSPTFPPPPEPLLAGKRPPDPPLFSNVRQGPTLRRNKLPGA